MLIVALALVEVDHRILLIQEAKAACRGKWFLPGGRMEPGESLIECVRREVEEEAGLQVEPLGLSYLDQMVADEGGHGDRLRFVFKARPVGGELKQFADAHSLGAEWFSRREIGRLPLRAAIVSRMVAASEGQPLLPMSSLQTLTPLDQRNEQP